MIASAEARIANRAPTTARRRVAAAFEEGLADGKQSMRVVPHVDLKRFPVVAVVVMRVERLAVRVRAVAPDRLLRLQSAFHVLGGQRPAHQAWRDERVAAPAATPAVVEGDAGVLDHLVEVHVLILARTQHLVTMGAFAAGHRSTGLETPRAAFDVDLRVRREVRVHLVERVGEARAPIPNAGERVEPRAFEKRCRSRVVELVLPPADEATIVVGLGRIGPAAIDVRPRLLAALLVSVIEHLQLLRMPRVVLGGHRLVVGIVEAEIIGAILDKLLAQPSVAFLVRLHDLHASRRIVLHTEELGRHRGRRNLSARGNRENCAVRDHKAFSGRAHKVGRFREVSRKGRAQV